MPIDYSGIAAQALGQLDNLLPQWLPDGKREGREWKALNPTRIDAHRGSFSVNLSTGAWCDFATNDKGGDAVSLYAYLHGGLSQADAAKALAGELSIPAGVNSDNRKKRQKIQSITWIPIIPVPEDAPPIPDRNFRLGKYSAHWDYLDANNELMGYVCRFDTPEGKEVLPLTYCVSGSGHKEWKWQSFPEPRPLYGLEKLTKYPNSQVLIVEGEKCADAAGTLLQGLPVLSWIGGASGTSKIDFTPLHGRKIVIWPDADWKSYNGSSSRAGEIMDLCDQPGTRAMLDIYRNLKPHCPGILMVNPPKDKPDGWDVADAIQIEKWDATKVVSFIKERLINPEEVIPTAIPAIIPAIIPATTEPKKKTKPPKQTPPPEYDDEDNGEEPTPSLDEAGFINSGELRLLGHDHGVYYYLPKRAQQIRHITAREHSESTLLSMARAGFWESWFPGKHGVNWKAAMNALFDISEKRGIFSTDRIRGCGAWIDEGKVVLHFGDHLLVDGKRYGLTEYQSKYIYEQYEKADISNANSLSNTEAYNLLEITNLLAFEKSIFSRMLAGWIVVAPICGALKWRPHIWLTGISGSGKSWISDHIVKPCLGSFSLNVMGSTSEAGIRQELYQNAFPVTFDESEQKYGSRSLEAVIQLMRQSSSDSDSSILKGGAGGQSMMFKIRSCFCLLSVHLSLNLQADASRISVLSLGRHPANISREMFEALDERVKRTITPDWTASLRSRSVALIPQIRANADTFGKALAVSLGNQRAGDQMGILLAGAYSLSSNKEISLSDAEKWIDTQDWNDQREVISDTDEQSCLDAILQSIITVAEGGLRYDRTIGQLVCVAAGEKDPNYFEVDTQKIAQTQRDAEATLSRYGIKIFQNCLTISASHAGIRKLLNNTAWSEGWHRILMRIPDAKEIQITRFGPTTRTKAAMIPLNMILSVEEEE